MENQNYIQSKECDILAIVKMPNEKHIIVMGQYRVSKKEFDTVKEAEMYITARPWELIINITQIMLHYEKENQNTDTKESAKVAKKEQK